MTPTVTALCLTKNRREWLPQAIASWQEQDYPHKRLLILADNTMDFEGLLPTPADPDIQAVALENPVRTIGRKRNLGCLLINTELIASADDDDIYGPTRLSEQVERILQSGKAVTGFHSAKFTDGARWWKYLGAPQYALGASLMFRRAWWVAHPFQEINVGEDNAYTTEAWAKSQLATSDAASDLEPRRTAGDRMIVNMHAGNTSPKIPHDNWQVLK